MRALLAVLPLAVVGQMSQTAHAAPTVEDTENVTALVSVVQGGIQTPALRYGGLDRGSCEAELGRRHIGFVSVAQAQARGVLAPVRLTTALHGVTFHSALPQAQRSISPYEIVDCRLALALDDFSVILARYDVVEVVHFSIYRPPPSHAFPAAQIGHQHDGALAIDAGWFKRKDGSVLQVERDFHGRIGASTCGPGTGPQPVTPEATALRSIVCEAADAHLFNIALTPDYNWQHRNHFHLEVRPAVRWSLIH